MPWKGWRWYCFWRVLSPQVWWRSRGVSTISNSVKYIRRPKKYNAAVTMMLMGVITSVLLVSLLGFARQPVVHMVHDTTRFCSLTGTRQGSTSTRSRRCIKWLLAIYQGIPFFAAVAGFATVGVLIIASLTAFTGFPMIASSLADYQYLAGLLRSVESRGCTRMVCWRCRHSQFSSPPFSVRM